MSCAADLLALSLLAFHALGIEPRSTAFCCANIASTQPSNNERPMDVVLPFPNRKIMYTYPTCNSASYSFLFTLQLDVVANMADSQPKIVVSIGKDKYTVIHGAGMSFGKLRESVSEQSGLDGATFRFLCKGRSVKDNEKISTDIRPALLKVMALRTKAYHKQQASSSSSKETTSSQIGLTGALDEAREKQKDGVQVSIATVKPNTPKGDSIATGESFVVVRAGRDRYNVRIESTSSVVDLKRRLTDMEGIDMSAEDINLIFSGRQCRDTDILNELGVKRGSMLMMLARARHHDKVEARADLVKIQAAVATLEQRADQIARQVERRLVDSVEIRARLGEVEAEATVLRDQLRSNRCEDNVRKEIDECLRRAEDSIATIRSRMS